jgi:hypothetical protein
MDTNIDNYSINDILTLLSLPEDASDFEIKEASNRIINKMKADGKNDIAIFIEKARDKVLNKIENIYEDEETNEQFNENTTLGNWWKNEYPSQSDKIQMNRITERKQKIQYFDETHQQMNRERLGINQSYPIPVVQGDINPILQNLTSRIMCIDSQYRQNILPYVNNPNSPSYNTDYTLDLSDPLTNVLSMKLLSVQIPTTWYTFDHSLGNTCFEVSGTIIDISDGNYSVTDLSNVLNPLFASNGIGLIFTGPEPYTGKISFENTSGSPIIIKFYSEQGLCREACGPGAKINQNFGWNLGFRIEPDENGVISIIIPAGKKIYSDVPADTYGPKYFILVVDDFNNNHLNNGLVNIVDTTTKISIPNYYNAKDVSCNDNQSFMIRTAPRTLTQAQLYSVNEIIANRKKNTNKTSGPTTTDVLAIIPLQLVNSFRPGPYIQFGQALQANIRNYFGPVNIDRLRVKLLDDKGNLVNLHDNDWSFTLVVEELYQF